VSDATAAPTETGARERILAAAVERIASDGMDDVRIAKIAMDAGVSTSLVHYHFETREALLTEALEYSYELAGDVRIGEEEGDAPDHTHRLSAMADQLLPYPGLLERDWILWIELWLRAARHPELRPTASRLTMRVRAWFADGIQAGIDAGEFREADALRLSQRAIALADGLGVRVLIGDLPIEEARREIWTLLADALDLPATPPER